MAKHPLWKDEYWLLLLQLYQKKPMGVKPLYSKGMVDLSLEQHIAPEYLHEQMFKLRLSRHASRGFGNIMETTPRSWLAKSVC